MHWQRPAQVRFIVAGSAICATVGLLGVTVTPAAAAAGDPPALPASGSGCVGPSPVRYPGLPWTTARMAPYQLWPLSKGAGVTVAVLDSGTSAGAAGLTGAVAGGVDVVSGGPADSDCLGRGTALASIVAGRPVAGTGVVGMAPAATVLPIRITDTRGQITVQGLAKGIQAATTAGADVILVGTGLPSGSDELATATVLATRADIVVVAPVNDRTGAVNGQPPAVWFPAAYPQVLAVGGIDAGGRPTEATTADAGTDVLAPSVGAVVAGPSGDGHYRVAGSAVAAAYAAGTVAILRARYPNMSESDLRARLAMTAEHPPGPTAPGTVDSYAALNTVDPLPAQVPATVAAARVALPIAPQPDPTVARAWLICGGIGALTLVAGYAQWIARARRRRRS